MGYFPAGLEPAKYSKRRYKFNIVTATLFVVSFMLDFYQKRKFQVILGSRYTQAIVLVLTMLMLWSAYGRYQIANEMAERREAVEAEVGVLSERKDALQVEVDYLSDERGIEAEMRRQFDVAKEGEQVVVIIDDEAVDEVDETIIEPDSTNEKRWYQFWR
jgi:cell division protein FtsB